MYFAITLCILGNHSGALSVSNSLDLNQAHHSVGPDLGPYCLDRLSADDKGHLEANLQ